MIVESSVLYLSNDECVDEVNEYVRQWPPDIVDEIAVVTDVFRWDFIFIVKDGLRVDDP